MDGYLEFTESWLEATLWSRKVSNQMARYLSQLFMRKLLSLWFAATATVFITGQAFAWDYEGHRAVNQLALASLPADFPAFVRSPEARERIAFLAGEPDRWRNISDLPLRHINPPDHFFDLEDIEAAGISLSQLTEFRYSFTVQLAAGRAANPEHFPAIDPEKNSDHTRELIGFLPWSISECYAKLKSEFSYLKSYEELGTPQEIANAQANIIYLMGVMGHYVGDGAQPLHTTTNYNGWVGANPHGYTTARTFHSWIDGGFFQKTGGISSAALVTRLKPAAFLTPPSNAAGRDAMFVNALNYLTTQHAKVEPLYELEKNGGLNASAASSVAGRTFLENQILVAGNMLGSIWLTAWREAPQDVYLHAQLLQRKATNAAP